MIQRIEMRVDKEIKVLAERASAAAGCTLTEYVTRLIKADAPKVLEAHTTIELTSEQFDKFLSLSENPPKPSAQIVRAAKRLDEEGF